MSELAFMTQLVRDRLAVRFGPEVVGWCDALPTLVSELAARWELTPVQSQGGGTSRVFRCLLGDVGRTVWLKVTPDPVIAEEEAEALSLWSGTSSVVNLLAQDLAVGALLLEDVTPGQPVEQPDRRLPHVAVLLQELRECSPPPTETSALRPLSERIEFLFTLAERRLAAANGGRRVDAAVLERAWSASMELCRSGSVTLVHGDLHPANVLSGPGDRLVAIDPRPTWGDPDFDAVDWVLGGVSDLTVLRRRIGWLASMVPGQSPERVWAWCRAQAALNAVPRLCAGRDDAETRFLMTLATR
ncbi:aminoglycoside phosphotransferase family protein [Streptomyces sp. NPDC047706]|uniref:aminoglycoside phosphotransferase family protein n=1 Tax=Streptomyces sp. NPDC047706 TaxID=3365486 RepID=UPI00371BF5B4